MNLSDEEIKFLVGFKSYVRKTYMIYSCGGIVICFALLLFIIGIRFNDNAAVVGAMFFGYVGISIIVASRIYKKLYNIILILEPKIAELNK